MIFPKNCFHYIVWKWINWRWMARFRISLDQTSHSHVQFRKRHVIHVHWTGNGPERPRFFIGINFLRGNNHRVGPKSPKYIFTERLAISLLFLAAKYKKFDSFWIDWSIISCVKFCKLILLLIMTICCGFPSQNNIQEKDIHMGVLSSSKI